MRISDIGSKNELRAHIKQLRLNTDTAERGAADRAIFSRVVAADEYKSCTKLLAYVSAPIEVDTSLIIAHAFGAGKEVYAPRCVEGTRLMEFCRIRSFDDLESGYFGILEPKDGCERLAGFDAKTVCIVPALAYDSQGYRLGYGKGFYDTFLSGFIGVKLGICYDSCTVSSVFRDSFDVPVDILITDKQNLIFDRM